MRYFKDQPGDCFEDEFTPEETTGKKPGRFFKRRRRHPSFLLASVINALRLLVVFALVISLAGAGIVMGIAKAYVDTAPRLNLTKIDDQAQTSFFYDAKGNKICEYKGIENRVAISIEFMPASLRNAFVAVEDARFYAHKGVDFKRIVGAFVSNFLTGSHQGGSTITQQLIKNTLLSSELSYKRKIQEAYLAMQLETRYTKNEILESYLNTIYLGENYYGVKVAAQGYFGKELHQLSLRECAMLAGMTTNPYYYNCRRNLYVRKSEKTDYVKLTNNRTNYVLRMMYENQFITHGEYVQALDAATARVLPESPESKSLYPYAHYVEYAAQDVVQALLLLRQLPNTRENRALMDQELRTGGYKVYLALDPEIQTLAEQTLHTYASYPALRDSGDRVHISRNKDGTYEEVVQPQAACVVIDYRTGELKAIVGSRTAPTAKRTLNRAVDMNMPVGSSIKPIAVYAPAIELGGGAGAVVYNMPLPIPGWTGAGGRDSWPKNYGGSSYRGPETFRTALVKSDNTAAAQALMTYVGVDRSADFLLRLGASKEHINQTPFGLALGSSGLTPLEMATAFSVLGNAGVYQKPLSFVGIVDKNGTVVYDAHKMQQRYQVFRPGTAWQVVDMMKDAVSKGTGKAARIKGQTVAGKTGTNSEQRGVTFTGMTGWYAASVWIGHDNYKPLASKTTGGNSAARLWQTLMSGVHQKKGLSDKPILSGKPEDYNLVKVTTCCVSGQLATEACMNDAMGYGTVTEYWDKAGVPTTQCQMHKTVTICRDSGLLAGEFCPVGSRLQKAVAVLPPGHPLQKFVGTEYEHVLTDYLGPYATLLLSGDSNVDSAMLSAHTCPIHQSPQDRIEATPVPGAEGDPDGYDPNNPPGAGYDPNAGGGSPNSSLMQDALALLATGQGQLAQTGYDHPAYQQLLSAVETLQQLANTGAEDSVLIQAMGALTQAMAAVR